MDASKTNVYVFDNYIAQLVDGLDADVHKHGAYQLSVSVDGCAHEVGPHKDARRRALGHLTGPNKPHTLNSCSGKQVLIWIAPESTLGHHLGSTYLDDEGFGVIPDDVVAGLPVAELGPAIEEGWTGREISPVCDRFLGAMVDEPWSNSADLHPAIRDAMEIIDAQPQFAISAKELASRVALSTSRFLHLFTEQMGTPLRPHLQWLRLTDALRRVADGESVTDAAAAAGFFDAPHLNRSVQQYLGLRPTDFAAHPDITIEVCLSMPAP
ncbi:MAG: AraC family transcriptional regulator [Acidimicrobiales bacterium]|nr:AraC family transcriptional regulator [Acidimicrobiales bacterium]